MTIQKIAAKSTEAQSADLTADNIANLRALFPELITEGPNGVAVNVDVLKALVGDQTATDADEKYGLNWHGKRRARQLALTPSTGTLRPCPDESVDWDTTQNLMIEGDNLEVLKLLQKSYAGKVKLIYIDPPYNTGKDFVYPDNFQDNIKNYLELTGQVESGRKISTNTEASGRFHTDWLNMMYPRLLLARNLLREDGIVVVSIDEGELANMRVLGELIFGDENYCGEIVWKNSSKNDQAYVSIQHEYLLIFVKSKSTNPGAWAEPKAGLGEIYVAFERFRRGAGDDWEAIHKAALDWYKSFPESNPISDSKHYSWMDARGVYFPADISGPNFGQYVYDVPHPVTGKHCKMPASGWRYPEETLKLRISENRVHFGKDHTTIPNNKTYLKDTEQQGLTSIKYRDGRGASNRLESIFGTKVFNNPKDEFLLRDLFKALGVGGTDLVADFFAGSASSAHAVYELNREYGSQCRYLIVQYPEDLEAALASSTGSATKIATNAIEYLRGANKPANIAEIAKERLRLAGQQQTQDFPEYRADIGFRSFRLDSSNIRAWNADPSDLTQTLFDHQDHLAGGRTEADVLYELLLKRGLDLCVPMLVRLISGKDVYSVGGGVLLACLATTLHSGEVEPLAQGIIEWHKELSPAGDTTCVFRDSAFANDVTKTNMAAILEQNGIQNVRSI